MNPLDQKPGALKKPPAAAPPTLDAPKVGRKSRWNRKKTPDATNERMASGSKPAKTTGERVRSIFASAAARMGSPQSQNARSDLAIGPGNEVLCTVANGKIGSVYYGQERICTTHAAGAGHLGKSPKASLHFNVNLKQAVEAFKTENSDESHAGLDRSTYQRTQQVWILHKLQNDLKKGNPLPDWATHIVNSKSAPPFGEGEVTEGIHHLDGYDDKKRAGTVIHVSRGVAQKVIIPPDVLKTFQEAGELANSVDQPYEKNRAFYDHIASNAPDFLELIRPPEEFLKPKP